MPDPVKQARGRNNKVRGKALERVVAKLYNGWRNPDNGSKVADVETDYLVIEVKSLSHEPFAVLKKAWSQADHAAEATGKEPRVVVSFKVNGRRKGHYYELRRIG